jgi:hypothetical protein
MALRIKGRVKTLNCIVSRQCGGKCLGRDQQCRIDDAASRKVAAKLIASLPPSVRRKNTPKVQYISQQEARLFRAVVSQPHRLDQMISGERPHPFLRINKISDKQIQNTYDRLKATGNKALLAKITNAGIRSQGSEKAPKGEEKAKLFIGAYLKQGGRDFYTGKKINLALAVLDHLQPLSAGGKNAAGNLVITTRNVNFYKKDFSQEQLKEVLRLKTEGLDPKFGDRLRKALSSGSSKEILALKKAASTEIRKADIESAKRQAATLKAGRSNKEALAEAFKNGQWLKYGSSAEVAKLSPASLKELLREQGNNGGVYTWYKTATQTASATSLAKGNASRAIAAIQSGAKRADIPAEWLSALRSSIETNANAAGTAKIKKSLGSEFEDLF